MADNIVQEVNSPNILVITDSDQNQVVVTQPLTNTIEVATPGPQGTVGPIGPVGSSAPFTKITGSDSWFTTSSIRLTGSLQGTVSYALTTGFYYYDGDSSVSTSIDWAQGNVQELNLDNNPTLSFANGIQGQTYTLLLKQQLGGRRFINWPTTVLWHGGVTASLPTNISPILDTDLAVSGGFGNTINAIVIQPDNKFIVGGILQTYSGSLTQRIVRVNPSGSIDTSFSIGTGFNDQVISLALQADGKVLAGGQFTQYNGTSSFYITRLEISGSRDASFNVGNGFNGAQNSFAVQPDGKIIIGGQWSSYSGSVINRIARLNNSGSRDTTFNMGSGFNNTVNVVTLQPDGKVLVGGQFTSYSGSTVGRLARLNTDGTIDTSFNIGAGFDNTVNSIAIQPDGKVVVGGSMTFFSGSIAYRMLRLNPSGSRDTSFNVGTGFNGTVNIIAIQPDGKVVAGGSFNNFSGTTIGRIARLTISGSLDSTFSTGTGFNNTVLAITLQPDSKILVGGGFVDYNGSVAALGVRLKEITLLTYNKIDFTYNGSYYIGKN